MEGEGRIEACHNSVWGTLCYDYSLTNDTAETVNSIVCRQLGFRPPLSSNDTGIAMNNFTIRHYDPTFHPPVIPGSSSFEVTSELSFFNIHSCSGDEERLLDCVWSAVIFDTCFEEDMGVHCQGSV